MYKYFNFVLLIITFNVDVFAQGNFAPNASTTGTTAIHKDSSIIVNWATTCTIKKGWQNILDTTLGRASAGNETSAIGKAGINGTVSLGDKGEAILTFEHPIFNGLGHDFAVFENAFNDSFLELAFVEVSSDGINYVRFPCSSETQDTSQIDGFGELDATNINNLAGKYRANFGTPFDLEELIDSTKIDINNINYIKIIDVVGIINNVNTSFDNSQKQINDPFPTPFPTSGFDLDAIGIIHQFVSVEEKKESLQVIYPNPSSGNFTIKYNSVGDKTIRILDLSGKTLRIFKTKQDYYEFKESLNSGIYFIETNIKNKRLINKVIIQ